MFGGAAVDFAANVPGRARKSRERVVCADSVNFRRPGRKASSTPYAALGETNAVPAASRLSAHADETRCDDSDASGDDLYDYIDVDSSCSSRAVEGTYHAKVGMQFVDTDDDAVFVIDSVCRENIPGRRSSFAKLYFKYHEVDGSGEFEYTPCMEMLNSSWCQWQQTPSAAARSDRAARRVELPSDRRRLLEQEEAEPHSRITRSKR